MQNRRRDPKKKVDDPVGRREVTSIVRTVNMRSRQLKYFDVNVAGSVTTSASYNKLSAIAQGAAQSQRVGDRVRLAKIDIHLTVSTANTDVYNSVRLVWFRWLPNDNSLTPGTTSILENPSTQGTLSHYNYEGRKEYVVLRDKLFSMTGTAASPTTTSLLVERFTIHCDFDIVYNISATTGTCNVYSLVLSDSAITPFPELNYWARLWYYD